MPDAMMRRLWALLTAFGCALALMAALAIVQGWGPAVGAAAGVALIASDAILVAHVVLHAGSVVARHGRGVVVPRSSTAPSTSHLSAWTPVLRFDDAYSPSMGHHLGMVAAGVAAAVAAAGVACAYGWGWALGVTAALSLALIVLAAPVVLGAVMWSWYRLPSLPVEEVHFERRPSGDDVASAREAE